MSKETAIGHVKCKFSASLLPNNLSNNGSHVLYVHRSEVHLVENKKSVFQADKAESIKVQYAEKDSITQASFVKFSFGEVIVIVTATGSVFLFDETGSKQLHAHKLQKSQVALTARESILRGIASDSKSTLFIGTGSGDILVFSVSPSKFLLSYKLSGPLHRDALITCLVFSPSHSLLFSGDENGSLTTWTHDSNAPALTSSTPTELYRLSSSSSSSTHVPSIVTSGDCGHGLLVFGYSTGVLRVFNVVKRKLVVEIQAHARSVSAVQVHAERPIVASAGEDSYLAVYNLPTEKSEVSALAVVQPVPALLTGLRFVNGDAIAVTAYDSRFIFTVPIPN